MVTSRLRGGHQIKMESTPPWVKGCSPRLYSGRTSGCWRYGAGDQFVLKRVSLAEGLCVSGAGISSRLIDSPYNTAVNALMRSRGFVRRLWERHDLARAALDDGPHVIVP